MHIVHVCVVLLFLYHDLAQNKVSDFTVYTSNFTEITWKQANLQEKQAKMKSTKVQTLG